MKSIAFQDDSALPGHWNAKSLFPRINYNNARIPGTDSRGPETKTGSVETELTLHRIHDTLETRITEDASQPGGPSQGRLFSNRRYTKHKHSTQIEADLIRAISISCRRASFRFA